MNWKNIDSFTAFFQQIANPADDYELGIAYSGTPDGQENYLLSYNPRTRTRRFRKKIIRTFRHFGFSVAPLLDLFQVIPAYQCSWVLGIEQGSDVRLTLYIEELSRFLGAEQLTYIIRLLERKYQLPKLVAPTAGKPYILALDMNKDGIEYLKQYHFVPAPHQQEVIQEQQNKPLLIQRRNGCSKQKVYACYPYLVADTPEAWNDWHSLAATYGLVAEPFDRLPITSLGIRFAERPEVFSLYGCVVRPKGDSKSVSSPNN